ILAILVPTLLLADLTNIYIQIMLFTVVWMGMIGFVDDYIKVFQQNKKGLKGRFKIMGQIVLGMVISGAMLTQDGITVRMDKNTVQTSETEIQKSEFGKAYVDVQSYMTNVPFLKRNQLDYSKILPLTDNDRTNAALIFVPLVIFIITAVSN